MSRYYRLRNEYDNGCRRGRASHSVTDMNQQKTHHAATPPVEHKVADRRPPHPVSYEGSQPLRRGEEVALAVLPGVGIVLLGCVAFVLSIALAWGCGNSGGVCEPSRFAEESLYLGVFGGPLLTVGSLVALAASPRRAKAGDIGAGLLLALLAVITGLALIPA